MYSIDVRRCIRCGACQAECPADAVVETGQSVYRISPDVCTECGACVAVCPVDCIDSADDAEDAVNDTDKKEE